jgi:acetyltransferase-like isoleucine patch superfamily enzyme
MTTRTTITTKAPRKIPGDWYDGVVPENVVLDPAAYLETTYSFNLYRSRAEVGLRMDAGAAVYTGTMLDVGPRGRVSFGRCAMINVAWIVCDDRIDIGDQVLVSWNAVLMDTYRFSEDPMRRREQLERFWRVRIESDNGATPRPIRVGNAAWIGFDSVILPGVTIGEGSIVGCRSVVRDEVPPYTVVAGNPARIVRRIKPGEVMNGHG